MASCEVTDELHLREVQLTFAEFTSIMPRF